MQTSLGCIGCGNMGSAILKGLAGRDDLQLYGMDLDPNRLEVLHQEAGLTACSSIRELAEKSDYLLLCVKPHQVQGMLKELAPRLQGSQVVISIAAGVTLTQLKTFSGGGSPVVRVMPNTPAMVQEGVFAVCLDDPDLKKVQKEFVSGLFEPLGKVYSLHERYFDAFTAVVGSGPAYVLYFMEALVESGVTLGLTRAQSTEMVKQLFSGTAKMAQESPLHLSVQREMVTSPAGTTIQGLNVMDAHGVRAAIVAAVEAAYTRSIELGQE